MEQMADAPVAQVVEEVVKATPPVRLYARCGADHGAAIWRACSPSRGGSCGRGGPTGMRCQARCGTYHVADS